MVRTVVIIKIGALQLSPNALCRTKTIWNYCIVVIKN